MFFQNSKHLQKENLLSLLYFDSTFFPEEPCLLGEDVWGGPEGVRAGDPGGAGQLKPGGDPGGARQLKPPAFFPHPILPP